MNIEPTSQTNMHGRYKGIYKRISTNSRVLIMLSNFDSESDSNWKRNMDGNGFGVMLIMGSVPIQHPFKSQSIDIHCNFRRVEVVS